METPQACHVPARGREGLGTAANARPSLSSPGHATEGTYFRDQRSLIPYHCFVIYISRGVFCAEGPNGLVAPVSLAASVVQGPPVLSLSLTPARKAVDHEVGRDGGVKERCRAPSWDSFLSSALPWAKGPMHVMAPNVISSSAATASRLDEVEGGRGRRRRMNNLVWMPKGSREGRAAS